METWYVLSRRRATTRSPPPFTPPCKGRFFWVKARRATIKAHPSTPHPARPYGRDGHTPKNLPLTDPTGAINRAPTPSLRSASCPVRSLDFYQPLYRSRKRFCPFLPYCLCLVKLVVYLGQSQITRATQVAARCQSLDELLLALYRQLGVTI